MLTAGVSTEDGTDVASSRPVEMRAPLGEHLALVTGGLSGMGAAIVDRLAGEGCDIVILSLGAPVVDGELRHFENRSETATGVVDLEKLGSRVRVIEGDVASREDIERVFELSRALGEIDIVVNNAATNCFHPLVGHDEQLWRRVIDVNLVAPFMTAQVFLPGMLAKGFGRIVSIASTNAHVGSPGYSAYCSSKYGLLGLTRSLALEVAGSGVTVNTVSPSFVDTAGAELHVRKHAEVNGVSYDEMLARVLAELPQGRFIRPDEVAHVVAFLCAESSASINGADIAITGAALQ